MIKTLSGAVREYKWVALLTPLCMLGEVIFDVTIPLLMADLIDYGINAGDMSAIMRSGALLLGAAFAAMLCGVLSGRFGAVASAGFAKNLRHDLFHRLQGFSFANIDKFSTASIVTRLTTDVQNVQNAFQMLLRMACRAPAMLVFALAMAFRINSRLSLVFLAVIPLLALGLYLIMTRTHTIFERVFRTYDTLNRVVQEDLRGIRVVKSFVREKHETQKFSAISESICRDFVKAERNLAFNMPLMQLCSYGCMLLISWFGARMIVASGGDPAVGLSTGQLTSLLSYIMQILSSLMMLSMILVMLVISRASAERISELLCEESSLRDCAAPALPTGDGSIRFENVSFSYLGRMERLCLRNVNLEISSGETVGILGGTGSAKSTLVSLIPRLYDATQGTVYVGGADVRTLSLEALRGEVAMVLQKNVLFSGTIAENLRWGDPEASDEELVRVCKTAQAHAFITAFPDGYETQLEQGGANLSGGQRQRLCIARALLKQPKILILDDSTSAVDTHTDERLRAALRRELPQTTKLIIAQRVASVQDADKIIVMENGAIDAVGTHEQLLRENAIYREVCASQGKGAAD